MGALNQMLAELTRHGSFVLFSWITAEQLGAPLPVAPILLAADVLSATGHLSPMNALCLGVLGCLIGDTAWCAIGKKWGTAVLRILCRISLEPETCILRGSYFVSRFGSFTLLAAKFIPGASTIAVLLAVISGISLLAFFSIFSAAYSIRGHF